MHRLVAFLCTLLVLWLGGHGSPAHAQAPTVAPWGSTLAQGCAPRITRIQAAQADAQDADRPPQHGWQSVTLPDNWVRRWPGHDGTVWYRIDWSAGPHADCRSAAVPVALTIDAILIAGAVYSNHDLLWRDLHLTEPLSRSWSTSRYWLLPSSSLRSDGANTIWVRVAGLAALRPGLGTVQLGTPADMLQVHNRRIWQVRTAFQINLTITAVLGLLALGVWVAQRKQTLFGWYALVSLCWLLFASNVLLTEAWPFPSTLAAARANHLAFIAYVFCFYIFSWHLLERPLSRRHVQALGALALGAAAIALASPGWTALQWVGNGCALVYFGNIARLIAHALRTRRRPHLLIAATLALLVLVSLRDILVLWQLWDSRDLYSAYTCLLFMLLSAQQVYQRILRSHEEMQASVARAREDLRVTLSQEHALALHNAHLQERLQLAQDLHDGLGGQIVRSIMLVEQSAEPPSKDRYLSMLKLLRDDLRQVVDSDGSIGAATPATPQEWLIPLRYRFVSLFDDLEIDSDWQTPPHWRTLPGALQCMVLQRVAQEALTNAVKHSRARMVRVSLRYEDAEVDPALASAPTPTPAASPAALLVLRIEDNGIGFDAAAALRSGMGIGMSSMHARMERMGGRLHVRSRPGQTVIEAVLLV
ncbi:Uncharacterised protein [uncultured Comamonas sp.]|nr:Uncharacterised protein [uncultured Comamonas sp.]